MSDVTRVHKNAYYLMSISSVLQLIAGCSWVFTAVLAADRYRDSLLLPQPWLDWFIEADPSVSEVLLITLPSWLGIAWALMRLRSLGKALYAHAPISNAVALEFKRLARAVAILLGLMLLGGPIMAGTIMSEHVASPPLPLGVSASLMFVAIILVLRSVAVLMREACDIDDENRRFV